MRDLGGLSWNDAWDLTSELLRDPTSHTVSSVGEWSYVPPAATTASYWLLEGWLNAQRKANTVPVHLPRPWETSTSPKAQAEPPAPSAESLQRRGRLADRLGLST